MPVAIPIRRPTTASLLAVGLPLLVLATGAVMVNAASIKGQSWRLSLGEHGVKLNAYPHHGEPSFGVRRIGCYPGWEGSFGPCCFVLTYG